MLSHDHSLQSYQKDMGYAKRTCSRKHDPKKRRKKGIAHIQGKE
jgi:hypothetical protein